MKNKILNLFKKKEKSIKPTGRMIDYRTNYWGHSIGGWKRTEDNSFSVHGFCNRLPIVGDECLHKFSQGIGVCIFLAVEPCDDPKDMYFARVGLTHYATNEDYDKLKSSKEKFNFLC